VEILRGRPEAALAAAQLEPIGVWRDDAVALARQIGNDRKEADAALSRLIKDHAHQVAFEIAEAYALRNDEENTFVWLDRAWTNREADILFLRFDPFLQRFANEPRFEAFCKKVGLPLMADR
jgi:DNA-directed RNA polymerase sigma subunit (sigma70/sigma32)